MPHDVRKSAWDALETCRKIQAFTAGQTLTAYRTDDMRRSAVERQFEILGEAFNRIDDVDSSFRDRFPDAGRIIEAGNRISHEYDSVDNEVIWNAAQDNVPLLMAKLEAWLNENQ